MASEQERVDRVLEELEERGARAAAISGNTSIAAYAQAESGAATTVTLEYDGEKETVRHAVGSVDQVDLGQVQTEQWPGGDVHVTAEIMLLDGGSGGANPRGHVDTSPSSVPEPEVSEDDQDAHVPPGGTWAIRDENGIADEYEVEVWPVRCWEPVPDVPAITMLRYIPAPEAHGLEWWSGYVRLAPEDGAGSIDWQAMRNRLAAERITHDGHEVPFSYYDTEGWVGWSAADLPVHMAGIPVYSSADTDLAQMSNQDAGSVTEQYAKAARKVRAEVMG